MDKKQIEITELPIVTVVTETYKKFDYLEKNIQSVLNQTYPKIEYIIADDGSGNFPLEKVKEIISKNRRNNILDIKYLISEENKGTVKNEGNAYQMAIGEYLMPLAGDDEFYDENVVSNVVKVFLEKRCAALCVSRVAVNKQKKIKFFLPHLIDYKKIENLNTPYKQYNALATGKFYNMASGSVLYLKKDLFTRLGGYDGRFVLWEDSPFLLKMFSSGVMVCTEYSIKGIFYRLGGVSTGEVNPKYLKDIELYNSTLLYEHYCNFPLATRSIIEHNISSSNCANILEKAFLYLKDWKIMFGKVMYTLREKIGERIDVIIVNRRWK